MTVLFARTAYDPRGGGWALGTVTGLPCAGDVSSLFGATDMVEHSQGHNGTDIAAAYGTPILAPCDMVITDVFSLAIQGDPQWDEFKRLFGNSVWATIGDDWRVMFAHLAEPPSVHEGQVVEAGTLLGYVGSTGLSTGPHLHWTLGPAANRWLGRGNGNVEVLDYCGTDIEAAKSQDNSALIRALQDARAAIDRATALVG
jgi:murein DD-endopeptidase MepM/ murein hydrolase activator NlpD